MSGSPFIPVPSLNLLDLLLGEHAAILSLFRRIELRLPDMDLAGVRSAGDALEALLMAHAVDEDGLLFNSLPAEERGVRATLEAMFSEHQDQRRMLEELQGMEKVEPARSQMRKLIELTREHFAVEERVLFGLAKRYLEEDRLRELGAEFARRRGISTAFSG